MNILNAITDRNLFRSFLADRNNKLKTWTNWAVGISALYGLPIRAKYASLIHSCTGRDINLLPVDGFDSALFLTGRRSGKSRTSAVIGAYEACFSGKEKLLAPGETGMVAILAPTAKQARIVKKYLRQIFESSDLLRSQIVSETKESFTLANGVVIEILVGDWRTVRGYTLIAAIVDEVCFFGLDPDSKVRSDTELIRALKPSLATIGGRLICISSPYAKRGWAHSTFKKNWGNDNGSVLVWNCASRVMNPTLPKKVVDEALKEDLASAKSEYLGEFRDDIAIWLPIEVIESVVHKGRRELLPKNHYRYFAFVDVSGGRSDDAALAVGHREVNESEKVVVVDCLRRYAAPHSPFQVIGSMGETLRKYGIRKVFGDNYSAEFVADAFRSRGFRYEKSALNKSALYLELLPTICSRGIELLDDEVLIKQLAGLERRTRSGGKDAVDHCSGGKDDIANSVAGLSFIAAKGKKRVGAMPRGSSEETNIIRIRMAWARMARVS
ncbi:MAG: hypothetical protein FVQ85_21025 [Planctomycetes bacterium]|nr:hypothetical protein [Planctomycetota bacterium]